MIRATLAFSAAALFLYALASPPSALAQDEPAAEPITYRVTALSITDDHNVELVRETMGAFHEALRGLGFREDEHPNWTFAIAVKPLLQEEQRVALSFVATAALPERVVDWARETQVFYLAMSDGNVESLPPEGRFIREYMSEDYIRQYGMLQDHEVIIVNRSDVLDGASSLVSQFWSNHFRP